MSDFNLIKSFDIDDGELADLSPQECFVLGYELAQIDELVKSKQPFSRLVHAHNRKRVEKSCRMASRRFKLTYMPEDISESWMRLEVT